MKESAIFICGANGQLGTALRSKYPEARFADVDELDITSKESVAGFDWSDVEILINAAAYTNVDGAEADGRQAAWAINTTGVANLVEAVRKNDITLVHVSTDYVFDGVKDIHSEEESFAPLSVYGSSKAAADLLVNTLPNSYTLRTSWVIGEGNNFVRTMIGLAKRDISPAVVDDQFGRLTFTSEIVRALDHILSAKSPYGTYNVTNSGPTVSWADITKRIFTLLGRDDLKVTGVNTEEYFSGKENIAPRPLQSTLSLEKLQSLGFKSRDWNDDLELYIDKEAKK